MRQISEQPPRWQSDGDSNTSPVRAAWSKELSGDEVQAMLDEDENYFLGD